MADNTILNPASGGDVISTDDIGGGVKVQRVKLQYGTDGNAADVNAANPLPTSDERSASAARTSSTSTSEGQILAANADRIRASFFNQSDKDFLLGEGATVVSTSDFSVRIQPGGFYAIDDFTGPVRGMFVSAVGSGQLNITELS